MEEKRDSTFEVRWGYVVLGALFGLFGLIGVGVFVKEARRDKLHSTLLGCAISLLLNFIYLYAIRR
jgi:hypothetical protein